MSTPKEDGNKDQAQRAAALAALRDYYRRQITVEQVKDTLDLIHGNRTRSSSAEPGWRDDAAEVWQYLSVTRLKQKLAAGAATSVAMLLLVWVVFGAAQITVRTPARWQTASGIRLPDTLRFRPGKATAQLQGAEFNLPGTLGGILRKGSDLTSIDVTFSGKTSAGEALTFSGTLLLTNAPGVTEIRRRKDFTGALLSGKWIVGTNAPVHVEGQPYLPE